MCVLCVPVESLSDTRFPNVSTFSAHGSAADYDLEGILSARAED